MNRGNGLPETMIVMSLLLMLLFGAVNLTLIGYGQISADGASYIAARAAAVSSPSSAPSAAAAQVAEAFPRVAPSSLTLSDSSILAAALVAMTAPGLSSGSLTRISAREIEPLGPSATLPPSGIAFSVSSATLKNYVSPAGVPNANYQAALATRIDVSCADSWPSPRYGTPCWQAQVGFDDWCSHDSTYDAITSSGNASYFPTPPPGGGTAAYAAAVAAYAAGKYSTTRSGTAEYTIASWDAGTAPSSAGACSMPAQAIYTPPPWYQDQ